MFFFFFVRVYFSQTDDMPGSKISNALHGAPASAAQLVGHRAANQKAAGLIPSQGTCLGCRVDPQSGCGQEAVSVSL